MRTGCLFPSPSLPLWGWGIQQGSASTAGDQGQRSQNEATWLENAIKDNMYKVKQCVRRKYTISDIQHWQYVTHYSPPIQSMETFRATHPGDNVDNLNTQLNQANDSLDVECSCCRSWWLWLASTWVQETENRLNVGCVYWHIKGKIHL